MTIIERTGPSMNRGGSKQDYGTPWEFIRAVEAKWGPIIHDLACTRENAKAPSGYYYPEDDAFAHRWHDEFPAGNLWLNPPFSHINPWAERCAWAGHKRDGLIFFLTPASIGSEWFRGRVYGNARVLGLSPRLIFEGTPINPKTGKPDGYPKDLMLSIFGKATDGFALWRWKP